MTDHKKNRRKSVLFLTNRRTYVRGRSARADKFSEYSFFNLRVDKVRVMCYYTITEKERRKKMKLYKIQMITYYEIEAESFDEAFDKMTNENISDSWVDCYEEEEIGKEEEND